MTQTALLLMTAITAIAGCGSADPMPAETRLALIANPRPKMSAKPGSADDPAGIHNLVKISERIYSGSEPHGEQGFASLVKLGVKTVVSVDGARPNVEAARRHGIRYIHIPIGYDGIPVEAGLSLACAVKEGDAPIYVHCHHGKHRGPAAAAVASIASGDVSNNDALNILERAGTSKDYQGLWRDVENFDPPPPDAKLPDLVEFAEVGSFSAAMAQADRAFDNLKLCRDANWGAPKDHPDLISTQEALLLIEGLHEAGRNLGDVYDEPFKEWLARAETEATNLRNDLEMKNTNTANERLLRLENSCKLCHQTYRDN